MTRVLVIAAGGAVGSLLRYWLSTAVYSLAGTRFPWGTLSVNLIGSILMGLMYVLLNERMADNPELRAAVMIGLLGAFTTFSTFSIETLNLFESGEQLRATLNIVMSVTLCVLGSWVGVIVGRQL